MPRASTKEAFGPSTAGEAVEDLERTPGGLQPGEAAAIGSEIELAEVEAWASELEGQGYRTYPRNQFGQARIGNRRLSALFTDQRARPDMIAINESTKTILVGDVTASSSTTAAVPGRIGEAEGLHIEKTIEYAKQLRRQLPAEMTDWKVLAQDRHWKTGGATKLIDIPLSG